MTSAHVVETSVTNNSSFQNYSHPDDHIIRTTVPSNQELCDCSLLLSNSTAKHLFGFTAGLRAPSLQGSTLDVIEAYKHVNVVREQLKDMRENVKTAFASSVYEKINKMA